MIGLSNFKEFFAPFGWFLALGKKDTEHIRAEVFDLLQHCSQSLKSLMELSDALEEIPKKQFNKNRFWPIQRHCLWFFTSPQAARQARSHCTDINRDVARINFKMAKILRTENMDWKGINDSFKTLMDADSQFLDQYEKELERIGQELGKIGQLLDKGNSKDAWQNYEKLRTSLMDDRASLHKEFVRMNKAEVHIRKLLS